MIARATRKAEKAGVDVVFQNALAESLPFPDGRFDVVLVTVMLHHLARAARLQAVREMRRVLKPGGRLLAVDFGGEGSRHGLLSHFHRHGRIDPRDHAALISDARLKIVESGTVGIRDLQFVLAAARQS